MKLEHKVVPVMDTKVIDEEQGVVGAFVSVTGAVDSVKDRIIPGAYQKTLVARTPKGVWSHDWDKPVSKTLNAEELLPGDDRLPSKTRDGAEWPSSAGALYVETQFNLDTQRGREAFSDVKFYGPDQEWSIGYNVPAGASKVDGKTGVRELSYIDLYEYSPVLFGAMSLTSTAGVKDAQEAFKAAVEAGSATPDMVVEEEREDPSEVTAADVTMGDVVVVPAGTLRSDASRLLLEAMAGKDAPAPAPTDDPEAPVAEGLTKVTEDTPITTPADPIHQVTPGHTGDAAGVEVEDRPEVDPREEPKSAEFSVGLNEEGQDALNEVKSWFEAALAMPGADPGALFEEAVTRQKAILDDRANFTVAVVNVEDGKAHVTLTGSYEERVQACQRALRDALEDVGDDVDIDMDDTDDWGYPRWYVTTEATFNNRVVAAAYDMNGESPVRFFEAGYSFDGQQAMLKNVREVRIEATVAAKATERLESMRLSAALFRKAAGQDVPTPAPLDPVETIAKDAEEDDTTTLSEADLLMLERLKLSA